MPDAASPIAPANPPLSFESVDLARIDPRVLQEFSQLLDQWDGSAPVLREPAAQPGAKRKRLTEQEPEPLSEPRPAPDLPDAQKRFQFQQLRAKKTAIAAFLNHLIEKGEEGSFGYRNAGTYVSKLRKTYNHAGLELIETISSKVDGKAGYMINLDMVKLLMQPQNQYSEALYERGSKWWLNLKLDELQG